MSTSYNNTIVRVRDDPPGATPTTTRRRKKEGMEDDNYSKRLVIDYEKCKSNKQRHLSRIICCIISAIALVVVTAIYHDKGKWLHTITSITDDVEVKEETSSSYGDGTTAATAKLLSSSSSKSKSESSKSSNFTWDLIDVTTPGVCGNSKCFMFAKETNPKYQIAYALADHHPKRMRWVWERAQILTSKYDANHIYLEASETIHVSRDLWYILDGLTQRNIDEDKMHQTLHLEDFIHFANPRSSIKDDRVHASIQKVQVVAKPFLEIGHGDDRRQDEVKREWKSFVESINDTDLFKETLLMENKKLEYTVKREPWLQCHFQILIDNKGKIYHFDLDRAFTRRKEFSKYEKKHMSKFYKSIKDMANLKMPEW